MPKGVIAAGHSATAAAGREVLQAGGNAADAAVAAGFAACVAEPLLTGLGGGGFALVHDAQSRQQTLLDFFIAMPGEKLGKRKTAELIPTPVNFGETTQLFHGGHASVGVPGTVAGLCELHRCFGTMPLRELVAPAKRLASDGVIQNEPQQYLIELLAGVIALTPASKKLFFRKDNPLRQGDVFRMPEIITTLDAIADTGGADFYTGDLAKQIVSELAAGGGYITELDLASYNVASRRPVRKSYRRFEIISNPPPSSGGALIAHTLQLLSHFDLAAMGHSSAAHLQHLIEALTVTNEVRSARFETATTDEDALEQIFADHELERDRSGLRNRLGNTTHLSVMDAAGNAVTMTASNGSGSGVAIEGTGILCNNVLGEEDLNPQGFHTHPVGDRLTSMMAPTLVTEDDQPVLAVGSAGSNRIRSAIVQVISNVIDFDQDIEEAIDAPRIHIENDVAQLEAGISGTVSAELAARGLRVSLWPEKNLYFGGVQAVRSRHGELTGAGDPRRGGVVLTA